MNGARARLLAGGSLLVVLAAFGFYRRGVLEGAPRDAPTRQTPMPNEPATHPVATPEAPVSPAELTNGTDPKLLSRLAESSDDPRVVEASFAAILSTYASRSTRKPAPDPELSRAIVKHVRSQRASSARAALNAARIPLMTAEPSETVTAAVVALAAPERDSARRHAALETLNLIRPNRRNETVLLAFEGALDAKEPHLVAMALLALSQSRASVEAAPATTRERVGKRVVALLGHHDAGVRGHSLLVLSEIQSLETAATRYRAALRALSDRDPYVRARAADLLARGREPAAIHALIEHVHDLAPARYELRGWSELDGSEGALVLELPGRRRVADAALFAIVTLGEMLRDAGRLQLTLGRGPASDAVVLENAELARNWYRAEKPRIPKQPGAPEGVH
jgi:hypothetical protein